MSKIDPITDHILNEIKTQSKTTISPQTKIKRAAGQMASIEARKRNDPLYQRMTKYKDLYFKYKEMVYKKYGPRVRSKARR
jgi:hypothetical protein